MLRIIFILFLFFNSLFSSIIIDKKEIKDFRIQYLFDKNKKLKIEDIKDKNFKKLIKSQFSLGYIKGYNWFKLKLENKSQYKDFIIYISDPYFENAILYEKTNDSFIKRDNGLAIPLEERSIKYHNPSFQIKLNKNEKKLFYLKLYSPFGNFSEIKILERNYFFDSYITKNTNLYSFYLGTLIILIFFNLFLYLLFKDKIYIYYVAYIISFTIFILLISGYSLYLGLREVHYELHLSAALFISFLLLFSKELLDIKRYNKKLNSLFNIFIITFFILAILIIKNIEPWYQIMSSLASIIFIILLISSIYVYKKGQVSAKYYILALCIYMITIASLSSMANGWLENNDFNRYSFMIGSIFELVFFSLLIITKFNLLQNEKLELQKNLILLKSNNTQILEKEIYEKTKDIVKLLENRKLLVNEVFFRINNNFNILKELFKIKSSKFKEEKTKLIFQDFLTRINSLASIHELLYENNKKYTKAKVYVNKIIDYINTSIQKEKIEILTQVDDIKLHFDDALSLGIIINEAINNSIKYNKSKEKLSIKIKISSKKQYITIEIIDNGVGLKENYKKGLGINLIEQFSNKLFNSDFKLINNKGLTIFISFEART